MRSILLASALFISATVVGQTASAQDLDMHAVVHILGHYHPAGEKNYDFDIKLKADTPLKESDNLALSFLVVVCARENNSFSNPQACLDSYLGTFEKKGVLTEIDSMTMNDH